MDRPQLTPQVRSYEGFDSPFVLSKSNRKGGVKKTTSVVNIASALTRMGYVVWVIDTDSQMNLTDTLGYRTIPDYASFKESQTIASILGSKPMLKLYPTFLPNLFLVPSHESLSRADVLIAKLAAPDLRLKKAIENTLKELPEGILRPHFILIDTPRDLNFIVTNAFVASDYIIIPTTPDYYAIQGIKFVGNVIKEHREYYNPNLNVLGIFLAGSEPGENLSKDTFANLKKHFGDLVFNTIISKNVHTAEAAGHHMDIFSYKPTAPTAGSYKKLTLEILDRLNIKY